MNKNSHFISLKPFSGELFLKNRIFEIDNGNNIFFNFKKRLQKYNIDINTIDIEKEGLIHRYVYCDIPYPWEIDYWRKIIQNKEKNILFCFESPLINPFNHLRFLGKYFRRIYTWNDNLVDNKKYFKLHIPQLNSCINTKELAYNKKSFLVMVNANKTAPSLFKLISPFKKDLYIERIKAIEFFENKDLYLYGKGWNNEKRWNLKEKIFGFKKFSSYRGEIDNKIQLISKFKFSLCFENCSAPGYVTEKIIDCLKARSIPIYWGAPNILDYIAKDCFIDFRKFQSYEELFNYLVNIDEKKYNIYTSNIENLLSNKKFLDLWFEDGFEKIFLESIS